MKKTLKQIKLASIIAIILAAQNVNAQSTNAVPSAETATQLPEVIVTGTGANPDLLKEEQPVGPYQQPEWTTERRFPGTRVYLQQVPWGTGFEQWVRMTRNHDGTMETRMQEEFEIGLPYRFQVDLYETWAIDQDRRSQQDEVSAEVRYALADWGVIPLNPTLYLEYAQHDHDPNTLEGKILLGTDLTPRWHWGLNLICEQALSGSKNTELAVSQGISYSLIDEKFGAGIEMEYSHVSRENPKNNFLIGPSLQWRPTSWCHVDLSPLFGCTHDSPEVQAFLVIGIDFGTGHKQKEQYSPASLKGQ
jgi:hypothetical protein